MTAFANTAPTKPNATDAYVMVSIMVECCAPRVKKILGVFPRPEDAMTAFVTIEQPVRTAKNMQWSFMIIGRRECEAKESSYYSRKTDGTWILCHSLSENWGIKRQIRNLLREREEAEHTEANLI